MITTNRATLARPATILKGSLISHQATLKGSVISHHNISTYPLSSGQNLVKTGGSNQPGELLSGADTELHNLVPSLIVIGRDNILEESDGAVGGSSIRPCIADLTRDAGEPH